MSFPRFVDSPLSWAVAGFVIGLGLGVTSVSVWLLAIGLVGFIAYLRLHGPERPENEGWLLAAAPAFMMSWSLGFIVHGLAF
jgi:hypothetical protein